MRESERERWREKERETERETERERERQKRREENRERERERQTDRWTDTHRHTQTHRHTEIQEGDGDVMSDIGGGTTVGYPRIIGVIQRVVMQNGQETSKTSEEWKMTIIFC